MTDRSQRNDIATLLGLIGAGALVIALVQGRLFAQEKQMKTQHDVYFLPPADQVVKMSLGYRHAFADMLWAHLLVGQGLRVSERRRFDTMLQLYDAINTLDPTFRTPYVMADALITFNIVPTTKENRHIKKTLPYEDVVGARKIMERGVAALPRDAELWLTLGQFVSFIAPSSYLEERPEEAERWRAEGVAYLARAVELSGGNSNVTWQALGGANILREAGELEASVRFLERVYSVTDDEELRETIAERLGQLRKRRDVEFARLDASRQAKLDAMLRSNKAYRNRLRAARAWSLSELPFIGSGAAQALGPPMRPATCAGPGHFDAGCATSWGDFGARHEAEDEE